MVTGWRRAFCTSIPKEGENTVLTEKQQHCNPTTTTTTTKSPRFGTKFGFFSNPSTPRMQSQQTVASSTLRCKTSTTSTPTSSVPNSPKLQCKTTTNPAAKKGNNSSPRLFSSSNLSSPKSPSNFSLSLLKSTLRVSKIRCGICLQSVKTGQGTAVFTAECSHTFHIPCITTHFQNHHHQHHQLLICPLCGATWKELPLPLNNKTETKTKAYRVYDDDEPLMSPVSLAHFNPIPESEETEHDIEEEFQGFFVQSTPPQIHSNSRILRKSTSLAITLLPEVAVVSVGRGYETYAAVLRVKAPPSSEAGRAPVDLVAVVDVSGAKLRMMKRAMRLVISSLCATDRLSIVAFSSTSKRLLPLLRMTANGRRSARRIVDALGTTGQPMSVINVNDALKKAAKVLEDRREKNPVASMVLLYDGGQYQRVHDHGRSVVTTTRFSHLQVPVHAVRFGDAPPEDVFGKLVGGLLSVVVQDVRVQLGIVSGAEVAAVYSMTGRPAVQISRSVRVGDMYAEEERDVLVEVRVPNSSIGAHHVMSVRSSYRDTSSQGIIYCKEQGLVVPRAHSVRSSSSPSILRLRNLHVSTRAVAESRRLIEHGNELRGAYHLLASARALLMQSSGADEFVRGLEAELAEVQRQVQRQQQQRVMVVVDEKAEQLTPTSAWRAAERLAKVAIMRKHMNRVSDLHGFENARF
ncbi:zf-RING_2 domain-containing protein/VWA_3 domain-containing protein [Cephalotus follicularis]|uniref:Zf-RING_2 domain-containing protein/VWA_3 domain-containing protein n=1 Tax=Cephalotus follicularis TaxID=3775 RepID=A0A1Q3B9F0_CEPFO|nr:zf-RING_2 domain-containing protein/VWA_3 domain-containing protein [Cephalotus follicularis]